MATGAVRLIDFHSGDQIGVRKLKGIPDLRGTTAYGSVQGRHCDVFLQSAHGNIRSRVDKAEPHPEKDTQKGDYKTGKETEDEFWHKPLALLRNLRPAPSQMRTPHSKRELQTVIEVGLTRMRMEAHATKASVE